MCRAMEKCVTKNKNRTEVDVSRESQNGDKASMSLIMRDWSVLHQ